MRSLSPHTLHRSNTSPGYRIRPQDTKQPNFFRKPILKLILSLLLAASIAGLYIHLFGPKEDVVSAEPGISFGVVRRDITAAVISKEVGSSVAPPVEALPPLQTFPWQEQFINSTVCSDKCVGHAKDGVCDDGRDGRGQVFCDLGTDCSDCGPWAHLHRKGEEVPTPVAALSGMGIDVYSRQTKTLPSFIMPFTNPKHDVDVSGQMHVNGHIEIGLTQVWYTILRGQCVSSTTGSRSPLHSRLVLDIGSNFGYYSLYAAAHGCRVVAWEPVPKFRHFIEYGMQLNHFQAQVLVRPHAVADQNGGSYTLKVPQRGIWGTASIGGGNIDAAIDNEGAYELVEVTGERVDSLVRENTLLIKLDVEGFEPTAFRSSSGLLEQYRVENIIMEYSPGVYDRAGRWEEYMDWPSMLLTLAEKNFTLLHMRDELVGVPLLGTSFTGHLPVLEEITVDNLQYDVRDAQQLVSRTMGCSPPKELSQEWPLHWDGCNYIPEDLHPKSFRGYFGHNTNVWATHNTSSVQVGEPVGVQSLNQSTTDWYSRSLAYGMGRRDCQNIEPQFQVRHRCKCLDTAVCGKEAQIVERLAAEGRLVPNATPVKLTSDTG